MRKFALAVVMGICLAAVPAMAQQKAQNLIFTWTAPTTNTDGSALTDLAGYAICLRVDNSVPADLKAADMDAVCDAVVDVAKELVETNGTFDVDIDTVGMFYVRISAYDESGNYSVFSNEASVMYDTLPPNGPVQAKLRVKRGK